MSAGFGRFVRERREACRARDARFSLRQVAARIGVAPSYLSRVEREAEPPPSEARIVALAADLGEDPDVLLALAGRVASDLLEVVRARPRLMARLLRALRQQPDHAVVSLVREARDGPG